LKLSKAGPLFWGTFFGGTGDDFANGIAVDSSGKVYVAGDSTSLALPQATSNRHGSRDAFLTVINSTGLSFLGTVDLGGSGDQSASAVALDSGGLAYLTGY